MCNVNEGMVWNNYGVCVCEVWYECNEGRNVGGEFELEECIVLVGTYCGVCKSGEYIYCDEKTPHDW